MKKLEINELELIQGGSMSSFMVGFCSGLSVSAGALVLASVATGGAATAAIAAGGIACGVAGIFNW
jgi:hypothetical protein